MLYTIIRIEEEDFGCEGRPEGEPAMVRVWLRSKDGEEVVIQKADAWMYEQDLDEGDHVIWNPDRMPELEKVEQ